MAVDIGNSRVKLGRFSTRMLGRERCQQRRSRGRRPLLPEPVATFDLPIRHDTGEFDSNRSWSRGATSICRAERLGESASVHRRPQTKLVGSRLPIGHSSLTEIVRFDNLTYRDVPLTIRVEEPARVGIDRLLAALAADRLRQRDRAAIVVDLGTAITVDLVEADGAFAGGAILPGIATSARALAEQTDALPQVDSSSSWTNRRPLSARQPCRPSNREFIGERSARFASSFRSSRRCSNSARLIHHRRRIAASGRSVQARTVACITCRNLVLSGIALVNA